MEDRRKAKRYLLIGAVVGGVLSLSLALLMDSMYADSLQGTWRDAIAKDLNTFFKLGVTSGSIIVYFFFMIVLGLLASFGALMGFIFSFFLYKFFSLLGSK
jgi:hypothetical protein